MEEDLLSHIAASDTVAGLVANAIQWAVREAPPSIALHLIIASDDQTLKGTSGLVQARVQIDCWATTFLAAKAIGVAVKAALPSIGQIVGDTKFLGCRVTETQRDRFGENVNILHRTRHDVRVSYRPA